MVVPELLVQQVGVEAHAVVFEPQVQQLAEVEDFGFVRYFGFEESVDEQFMGEKRNLQFSPFKWLRLGNSGLCFESKD